MPESMRRAGVNRRLTRNEAITVLFDAVKGLDLPFDYPGAWSQIVADSVCLDRRVVKNIACQTRKSYTYRQRCDTASARR